ncbi:MAG: ABC transporter ATP-binding protein [Candidatus Kaistia colombiensis]|nr:MAG: ABC transporter ATP-binding protein [Kaistia sp.]
MDIRSRALEDGRPTLSIRDLTVDFPKRTGSFRAVDGVSLDVWPGEIVGVIGESGSGKTMTALSTLRMLPKRAVVSGSIELGKRRILDLSPAEMRKLRGDRLSFIPQDAMRALNPTMRIGRQVGEPLVLHRGLPVRAAVSRAVDLLKAVHVREPERRVEDYPHGFSGGMQQRAMIAMGLALEPELIIADEPTTALDVTVQAQVLKLLKEIRDREATSILFITHDLGVVAELCDWVYVMYRGKIVEQGSVERIFTDPRDDYTKMLLAATPTLFPREAAI